MNSIKQPSCMGCKNELYYYERLPKRQQGVMMRPGERFCTYGKRARKFKPGDPKVKVPSWCPKQKTPCEVRVYEFKDSGAWYLYEMLCRDLRKEIDPSGHAYAVSHEGHADLTPKAFWEQRENDRELLGVEIYHQNVVEIDDGLAPVCFFKANKGYRVVTTFNTAAARNNPRNERAKESDHGEHE